MLSFVHTLILALLCSIIFVEAMPRNRPAKKAMRNSLVRFGKRGGGEQLAADDVFLGESYGPVETYEQFRGDSYANQAPSVIFY
ncbi:unnamed protein product [Caenorhabditis angaria]|uniref:Uncharacterized protein n=1 Tax=Caenorhabditis angaria TaxID=860376 RepID=A0A9P1N9R6_9PELO|nr:unnamed protein product [Caenorhabditis angaria]